MIAGRRTITERGSPTTRQPTPPASTSPQTLSVQAASLSRPRPARHQRVIALDWKDGRLTGIEILDATRHLHDNLLQNAETLE
jgi:hypothetical protein